ncbi:MAG: hypothetical protein NDI60_01030 [Elusimicrobiales bacterium]|nr:hypothetical protein [Elusimicrobiales bacterium]
MKKITLALAAVLAAAGAARAATPDTMAADLEKAGFTVGTDTHGQQPPKPVPQPAHPQPGSTWGTHPSQPAHPAHPVHPVNPGHPGYPPPQPGHPAQPWNPGQPTHPVYPPPQPGYPTHPWNPDQPGYPPPYQLQQFRFESGSFVFSSDARRSMENAATALQRAGYTVLEKRSSFSSYTLVFLAPSYLRVEKYNSGSFVFSSDANKAADEFVAAMERQGNVVLERNVSGTSFTVNYLGRGNGYYNQTQTYTSGSFVFGSDAARSLNEAVEALNSLGAIVLEKRLNGTSYTIVFQAQYRLEPQTYASGSFVFGSDAARSMNEAAAALQKVRGLVVMEKRLNGTSYTIGFFSPTRIEPQKYVSGVYTFSSEAQRAAAETAAAFASQGMLILEKNVSGTQFTITYFHPGYYY